MIPIRDSQYRLSTPYVTRALIALNVLVFLYMLVLSNATEGFVVIADNDRLSATLYPISERDEFTLRFGAVPELITGQIEGVDDTHDVIEDNRVGLRTRQLQPGRGIDLLDGLFLLITPLTAMFLHGGWLHLIGNMLFLWVFADNVEDRLGHGRFFAFYIITGYLAVAAHILIDSSDLVPLIGASGAISGVLGAYILLFPRAMIQVLIPIIFFIPAVIPAPFMIGFWFVTNLFNGVGSIAESTGSGGTAWWAHIGGFVAGMLLIYPFLVGRWRAPVREVGPTWNVPWNFGVGLRFGRRSPRRDEIPAGRDPRVDPPLAPPPTLDPPRSVDARLPADWRLVPPTPAVARRRRWGLPRLRRRRPGGVDAFRDPPPRR